MPAVCVLCENGKILQFFIRKYSLLCSEKIYYFFIMQIYQKLLHRDVEMYYFILNFPG